MVSAGNPGAIWTTKGDCGNVSQDVNHYAIGETIYINGAGFDAGDYDWVINGNPGRASCDSDAVVASGNYAVDSSGAFCFEAYTVLNDDCGEYKVAFGEKKGDNYRIDLDAPIVPEFGFYIGALTLLSAVGVFFLVRRN